MTSPVFYTRHDGGVTLMMNGKQSTVPNDHVNFDKILAALKAKLFDKLPTLMNLAAAVNAQGTVKTKKRVFARNGSIYYLDSHNRESKLDGALVTRIMAALGKPAGEKFGTALIAFLDNIKRNKHKDIRKELYEFLMAGKSPITYDGCFLAYKKVKNDFFDAYTGTMDNSPGKIVRMPASQVDTNRHNECSVGLHFAALGYMAHYRGGVGERIVIVKVNPKHVHAIPTDYQFQKGRASEYYVVGEYKGDFNSEAFNDSFIDEDTKQASAPNVVFVKEGLRPSLEKLAESYLIASGGLVNIAKNNGKNFVVREHEDNMWYDVLGRQYEQDFVVALSITTKSVRDAVKFAVAKLEDNVAKFKATQS
jgi:hypothetical protein